MTNPPPFMLDVSPEAWRLVAGIAAVLVLASLSGCLLRIVVARSEAHPLIDNLNRRITSWWLIVIVVGLALLGGRSGITLLFALASLAALREFVVAGVQAKCPRALFLIACLVIVPLQFLLVWNGSYLPYTTLIPIVVFVALPLLGWLSGNIGAFLSRTCTLRHGLLICVFCLSHIPALLTLQISGDPAHAGWLLIFLLLVAQASDVLQYLWGQLAGRHPIAPQLSPSKTIEGTVGGIASASMFGVGLSSLTPFTTAEAALISLLITLLGFAGGLAMSAIKRRRGIKDWGKLIPGHGGALDRLDSLILPAPVFYYVLRYGWAD
jgi:phosphatidate cytidylyltransferase